ncbi:MAG: hypothetical protein MK100_09790 [Phycisphaerales bacterium]|nr:hypothetical protein [Phycisphaerales bacterium]
MDSSNDLIRPLGFWEAATALNARRLLGASTMVILGEGRGPLCEASFKEAARWLYDRQIILQCRLNDDHPVAQLIHDVRFEDIPCLTQHADSETEITAIWEQLLHEELPDRRRLWEPRFAPTQNGDRWRVFLKVHHAIADGRSMAGMLNQFLQLAGMVLRGETQPSEVIPVSPPAEQRVGVRVSRRRWHAEMQKAEEAPPITPWPLEEDADIARRRSRVVFRNLDPIQAELMHKTCHDNGTTVLGALVAAISLTHARHAGGVVDTDTMIPVDMRRLFAAPPDPHDLQMCAYGVRVFMGGVKESDDPWMLARQFRDKLEPQLAPEAAPPWDFQPDDVVAAADPWCDFEGAYRHGFCPSNVGKLPFDGDHPPLVTDRIDMTAAIHFGGFPILVPMLMHKGVLRMAFSWTEPLMHEQTALQWIDEVWSRFCGLAHEECSQTS